MSDRAEPIPQPAEPWVREHQEAAKKEKLPEYQIGDIVQFKSGGPLMMVSKVEYSPIEKTTIATVIWHKSDGSLHMNQLFDCRLFKKVERDERNESSKPPAGS